MYLHDNNILKLEKGWSNGLTNLKQLIFRDAPKVLSTLSNDFFKGMENLGYLNLMNNKFRFTSENNEVFAPLKNLDGLDLSYNNLGKSINADSFKNLANLRSLWLMNANITQLDFDALRRPFCQNLNLRPTQIFISGNPLVSANSSIFTTYKSFYFTI